MLIALVERYRDHPALLGWDVRVGEGENNYPPPYVDDPFNPIETWCDYSPYAQGRFREWLVERYSGDVGALRAAWMSPTATFITATIPHPLPDIETAPLPQTIFLVNSSADSRPQFRDWLIFRLHEKWAETEHFAGLIRGADPYHILLSDPAYHPTGSIDPRTGVQDGVRFYLSPGIDGVVQHPRVAHLDSIGGFNTGRSELYNTDQYGLRTGTLVAWAKEETSEVHEPFDVDNIWRLASFDVMHAALGQGDGWTTGDDIDPWNLLPVWSAAERDEMHRLAPLHSAPDLRAPQPRVAILTDDFNDGFDYPLAGELVSSSRPIDRKAFFENLFYNGRAYDLLTVNDVLSYPHRLQDYAAVLVINLPRLTTTVAAELDLYRDGGGGLFVAGVTGVMDDAGRPDTTTLEILLDTGVNGRIVDPPTIEEWEFDEPDSLAESLLNTVITDNLYYIPTLQAGSGYTAIAHLTGGSGAPVIGYRDRTIFWFPRLSIGEEAQVKFQENLWDFFDVAPEASAGGSVEAVGGNYRSLFTPVSTTVDLTLDEAISSTGALVWDWNHMQAAGTVPPGPNPELTLETGENGTYFLGLTPRSSEVQFVALSGGMLGSLLDDVPGHRLAVGVYRAVRGEPVTVAIYPGGWHISDIGIFGAALVETRFDPTGMVYLITVSPLDERLTVTVLYEQRVYLPMVIREETS
jgi:hypothetical protein